MVQQLKSRSDKFELLFEPQYTNVCFLFASSVTVTLDFYFICEIVLLLLSHLTRYLLFMWFTYIFSWLLLVAIYLNA